MKYNCTKAIITAGGFGTRWLPLTKAIEKCMLPVCDRPVIDYVVADCIKAGIKDIYIVVGEQSDQMRRYYGDNDLLYGYLEAKGKLPELEQLKQLSQQATIHFVTQSVDMPYGTAIPVRLCKQFIEPNEQVLIVSGDQFVFNKSGESEAARFIQQVSAAGYSAGMAVVPVPKEEVSKYGIVEVEHKDGSQLFKRIVEKPKPQEAPGTLNNLCIYLFNAELLACVDDVQPINGEYYLTEALNIYVQEYGQSLPVVTTSGVYMDAGTVGGWLKANKIMAEHLGF